MGNYVLGQKPPCLSGLHVLLFLLAVTYLLALETNSSYWFACCVSDCMLTVNYSVRWFRYWHLLSKLCIHKLFLRCPFINLYICLGFYVGVRPYLNTYLYLWQHLPGPVEAASVMKWSASQCELAGKFPGHSQKIAVQIMVTLSPTRSVGLTPRARHCKQNGAFH